MKRIIMSLGTLVFAVAIVAGGTGAFFSDTETSENNVFTAGSVSVELMTVGHNYYGDDNNNAPVFDWKGGQGLFTLEDLKPLDTGMLDIDLENGANEAHICAMITGDPANLTNPEDQNLYDQLNFWVDGTGEQVVPGQWFDLGITDPNTMTGTGVEYCFGDSNVDGELISCDYGDGSIDYNAAQNGSFTADMMFFAIQTRNNEDFSCDQLTPQGEYNPDTEPSVPSSEPQIELEESSTLNYSPTGWAGWSCSEGTAVGGTVLVNGSAIDSNLLTAEGVAEPGAEINGETYPAFPHYSFSDPSETGYVAQMGGTVPSGDITIEVQCQVN